MKFSWVLAFRQGEVSFRCDCLTIKTESTWVSQFLQFLTCVWQDSCLNTQWQHKNAAQEGTRNLCGNVSQMESSRMFYSHHSLNPEGAKQTPPSSSVLVWWQKIPVVFCQSLKTVSCSQHATDIYSDITQLDRKLDSQPEHGWNQTKYRLRAQQRFESVTTFKWK